MKKILRRAKCMNTEYANQYLALLDIDNPYTCNFGKTQCDRTHSDAFNKFQNKLNGEFFNKK